jgi:hypothetical protein
LAVLVPTLIWCAFTPTRPDVEPDSRVAALHSDESPAQPRPSEAIQVVLRQARSIGSFRLNAEDLREVPNPFGAGTFVYSDRTQRVLDVDRQFLWLVTEGRAFAFNSPSKQIAAQAVWSREAPPKLWCKTALGESAFPDVWAAVHGDRSRVRPVVQDCEQFGSVTFSIKDYQISYGLCAHDPEDLYRDAGTRDKEKAARWLSMTMVEGPHREGSYHGCLDALQGAPKRF